MFVELDPWQAFLSVSQKTTHCLAQMADDTQGMPSSGAGGIQQGRVGRAAAWTPGISCSPYARD